jgi:hypothetical protein
VAGGPLGDEECELHYFSPSSLASVGSMASAQIS